MSGLELSSTTDIFLAILIVLLIMTAIFMSLHEKLTYAVGAFAVYGVLIGVTFMVLGSPLLAAIQVLVFSGTISVLMLAIISLERGDLVESNQA